MTAAAEELPLIGLFEELRLQTDLPLGLDEYLVMVRALQAGYGVDQEGHNHESALRRLCHILWTNSLNEQRIVDYYFDLMMEHNRRVQEASTKVETVRMGGDVSSEQQKRASISQSPVQEDKPMTGKAPEAETGEIQPESSEGASRPTGNSLPESQVSSKPVQIIHHAVAHSNLPLDEAQAARSVAASMGEPFVPTRRFVFTSEYLPITRRQMKQSWRHLRSLVREGPPTELNIEATVEKVAHDGLLIEPVLEPLRANRIELLLLVDRKGSMVPFHSLADRLVESAQKGGRLAQAGVYYFNNVPRDRVYLTTALIKAQMIDTILRRLRPERTVALVFSDAGAARGRDVPERVDLTAVILRGLKSRVRRVVWINPMPEERWGGTSAAKIAQLVPMFEFSRRGLDDAIDALRGRRIPLLTGR